MHKGTPAPDDDDEAGHEEGDEHETHERIIVKFYFASFLIVLKPKRRRQRRRKAVKLPCEKHMRNLLFFSESSIGWSGVLAGMTNRVLMVGWSNLIALVDFEWISHWHRVSQLVNVRQKIIFKSKPWVLLFKTSEVWGSNKQLPIWDSSTQRRQFSVSNDFQTTIHFHWATTNSQLCQSPSQASLW